MNQTAFADGPAVPMLVEGLLDSSMLNQLCSDLQSFAEIILVQEKGGPCTYTAAEPLKLEAAVQRLQNLLTRSIQIRYRFERWEWTDTILAYQGGFRVVRCRHDPDMK